jgi:hypothetical protein
VDYLVIVTSLHRHRVSIQKRPSISVNAVVGLCGRDTYPDGDQAKRSACKRLRFLGQSSRIERAR